ncbi:MAG: hypothetical protein KGI37_07580 [Alphaproteobacteria bacterium]|nr:hypothetical protein [Alphaproteobacteria bacterium]
MHVIKEIPADRANRRKWNKTSELPSEKYTTATGVDRVRVLHPTKGWRDRNIAWAAFGAAATQLRAI